MARDYKNTPKPKGKASQQLPGWAWLLTGLAIGLFVALLIHLKENMQEKKAGLPPVVEKGVPAEDKAAAKPEPENKTAQRPRFDFYNLLPEMEVLVPEQDLAKEREREPAEKVVYYLQVASFRKFEEADRLRAQLAFMNLESHIQRVTVNSRGTDEQTWHRVQVGPFTSAREMDKVRNRLREESMDPMILKVKS
jgi:cell division protein FtsN